MKRFAVIGCGRFGAAVARNLYQKGYDVLAIDQDLEIIQNMADHATHAVSLDVKDKQALMSIGMKNIDVAIVAIGSEIKASIMATLVVKEMGIKHVIAKAHDELHAKLLYKIGADQVILPERDMGIRLALNLTTSNILEYIELAPDFSIMEIVTPQRWVGKTLGETDIRAIFGLSVLAIKQEDAVLVSPHAQVSIQSGDVLVVVGSNDDLQRVQEKI
jgi:trk system potassium uptake protein